jgi:hypothetical protein
MDNPIDRLDGAPMFPRVLLLAFLTPQQGLAEVTNVPVPFLSPRHAGLHCYRWSLNWSAEPPFLPGQVRFDLDRDLVRRVSADAIHCCFRSGYRDRALFKQFQETQRGGAEYSVAAWTNWQGASLPLRAAIRFTTFEPSAGGGSFRQLLVVRVTGVTRPGSDSLIPKLAPGDGVQHVLDRTCYYYTSAGGKFLSPDEVKSVGRVLKPAPPPPRWVVAYLWLLRLPWQSIASVVLFGFALLMAGALAWWVARSFSLRR